MKQFVPIKDYMKRVLASLLLVLLMSFPKLVLANSMMLESHFDSYRNNISWKKEIAHLDNFAIALKQNPEMLGYIAFYTDKNTSLKKVRTRINRAKRFLIKQGITEKRLVFIYAGNFDESITILQPLDKSVPPPKYRFPEN